MRVYELASSLKVKGSEIVKIAKSVGVEVTSTFSSLDDADIKAVKSAVSKASRSSAPASNAATAVAKRAKAEAARKAKIETEKFGLSETHNRAQNIELQIKGGKQPAAVVKPAKAEPASATSEVSATAKDTRVHAKKRVAKPAVKQQDAAPAVKLEVPAAKPAAPVAKQDAAPAVKPEVPAAKPVAPVAKQDAAPAAKPEIPAAKPAAPVAEQDAAPAVKLEVPAAKPAAPVAKPEASVAKPETAKSEASPASKPAAKAPAISIVAEELRTLAPLPPSSSEPKIIFHRAEDDYDTSDDDDSGTDSSRTHRRYDDDFETDDDLSQVYLGRRETTSSKHSLIRPKDEARDDVSHDRNARGSHNLHGGFVPQGGRSAASAPLRSGAPRQGQRQFPGSRQVPGQRSVQQVGRSQGAQAFPTRPQGNQPFPTRPQGNQPFPTRPQASQAFPTRPQGNQPFPTRPQGNQPFPTRPQGNKPFPTRPQAYTPNPQYGGMMNGRPGTQAGRGSQQRGTDGRSAQQGLRGPQRGKDIRPGMKQQNSLPVAPPVQSVANAPLAGDHTLTLRGPTLVRELAEMMGVRPNKLIADLMQLKVLVSINQRVEFEMAGKIAEKYGFRVELERTKRSAERKPAIKRLDEEDDIPEDRTEDMRPRPPVVTFLGHVDHGKTSLLDYIRKSKVAAGEAGGITQHIGAYSVDVNDRRITFLDTPGHAAFAAMRARGAKLTDIAVIVIAADDGIMPQTREVIKDCRQANVQIMIAINKCDLPAAKPDRVRQQLQAEGLTPEEWGGDIVCCEVSAHTGAGMDNLLEMILLQADVLELHANPTRRADGYVIEAQMELGLGPTATLLVASGTLNLGDVVLIDEHYGRLRGLIDDRGHKVKSVGPAQAVRVMGLSGVPEAGAEFRVMTNEKRAKELAEKFAMQRKEDELEKVQKSVNIDNFLATLTEQQKKQLSIIVKADTQGTVEAICDTLRDIRSNKITLEILDASIGNVTVNDVQRAAAGNAVIVGFQINAESGVMHAATHDGVRINTFRIIYELFDFVKQSLLDLIDPEYKEVVRGHAQIRQIFEIGKKGKIAGSQLLDGVVRKDALVRVKRNRDVLFDGKISSLKHYKDEVLEVRDMQEFGISFIDFEDFAEGDVIECYAMEELERTL